MTEKAEDLSLPKATISKIIKEMLPDDIKCANDTRDLIMECCVEFIHVLSSESNEVCTKENKKTIAPEHILKALKSLGFETYVDEVSKVYNEHKVEAQVRHKGTRKLDTLGISHEELLREQQKLFAEARNNFENSPRFPPCSVTAEFPNTPTFNSAQPSPHFPTMHPPSFNINPNINNNNNNNNISNTTNSNNNTNTPHFFPSSGVQSTTNNSPVHLNTTSHSSVNMNSTSSQNSVVSFMPVHPSPPVNNNNNNNSGAVPMQEIYSTSHNTTFSQNDQK